MCFLPFLLLLVTSVSSEASIATKGYSFFPQGFSGKAYEYLWARKASILHAYLITFLVTIFGTAVSVLLSVLIAYPMSRKDFPFRKGLTFLVIFTMLFNGGLVPTYMVYSKFIGIRDTFLALVIPMLLLNAYNIIIMRTYFARNIPSELIEAAFLDGAGEWSVLVKIVLPMAKPIVATVGLMVAITYWNDWNNAMIYISDSNLFSLQYLLNRILMNIQFLNSSTSLGSHSAELLTQMPVGSVRMALAVIGALPILITFPFLQKYFEKGITLGSVKE